MVGNAFHLFFAADRPEFDDQQRLDLAKGIVQRWQLKGIIDPGHLVQASNNLRHWAEEYYPNAIWRREWPMSQRLSEGTVVSGFSDLTLEDGNRFAIIDHKTFAGNKKEAARKACEFSGQLKAYGEILQKRYEDASILFYIHYPIIDIIIDIDVK